MALGKPKYNYGDIVKFTIGEEEYTGKVYIIDAWGTFFDDSDVSYDIMVGDEENDPEHACLFKHIRENFVEKVD